MATNNTFLTPDLITKYMLAEFVNNHPFLQTGNRSAGDEFLHGPYQYGDTFRVRRQNHFRVGDGQVATDQPIIDATESIVLDHQYHTMIPYTQKDLTLSMEEFLPRYIRPAVRHILNQIEVDLAKKALEDLHAFTGSTASSINSYEAVDLANVKLREMAVNITDNAYCALSTRNASKLRVALSNAFNPTLNENITQRSALGRLGVFDLFESDLMAIQTAGSPGAGPITTTAEVASGNTIPMTNLTPATVVFRQGDVFSITGTFSLNPMSYESTGQDVQFVVTADVTSDGGGAATVPIAIRGDGVISDPSNPRQNVNQPIPSGATVVPVPTHRVNIAYVGGIGGALDIVHPPLEKLDIPFSSIQTDNQYGVSVRMGRQGDLQNSVNRMRFDVLTGFKWHSEYAVRLISDPAF